MRQPVGDVTAVVEVYKPVAAQLPIAPVTISSIR
jgi:hypothetical protein